MGYYPKNATAGGDIPRFSLVKVSGANVVVCAASTDFPFGCTQSDSGSTAKPNIEVEHGGIVKLTASAAIAKGAKIQPAAGGKIATYTAASGVYIVGHALEAASTDGQVIECVFSPSQLPDPTA